MLADQNPYYAFPKCFWFIWVYVAWCWTTMCLQNSFNGSHSEVSLGHLLALMILMLSMLLNTAVDKQHVNKAVLCSYCGGKVELLTWQWMMFGLFAVSSPCIRQMKAVCVSMEVILPQSMSLKLIMTQAVTLKFCLTSTDWVWKCCVEELNKPRRNKLLYYDSYHETAWFLFNQKMHLLGNISARTHSKFPC